MIASLTLNPSLDLTVFLKNFRYDDVNRIGRMKRDPGGKGINISRIIHRLGGDTTAFGLLGGYTGCKIKELLDSEGVPNKFVSISDDNRSNITIDMGKSKLVKLNEDGPAVTKKEIDLLIDRISVLSKGDFLVISGSLPAGADVNTYARMIRLMRKKGVKTVLDADGEEFYRGVKAGPFMIKPNVYEAARLIRRFCGKKTAVSSEKDLRKASVQLAETNIEYVMISWGYKGVIAAAHENSYRCRPSVRSGNAGIGSGDALTAGFLYRFSCGHDAADCIRWGVACGTASAMEQGTSLCRPEKIKDILSRTSIKKLNYL